MTVDSVFGRTGAVTAETGDYTPGQVGAVPASSDGHSAAPVLTLTGLPDSQGEWQAVVTVSCTAQYLRAGVAVAVEGSGGPDMPSSAAVRFAVNQDAAMASAPVVVLTADACQTIVPGNFYAVVTSNTSDLTEVTLYLQAAASYETYEIREIAPSASGGGTIAYAAGGDTWLSSLPSGTQQYAVPGPGSAAAHETGPLAQWLAAVANRHYGSQTVTCIGTSITSGTYLGNWDESWPVMLQDALNSRFPSNGLATHGRGLLLPVLHDMSGVATDYVTISGTPAVEYNYGMDGATYDIDGCTVTYDLVGTTAYILCTQQPSGGDVVYKVDSGSNVSTSTAGATTQSGQVIGPITLGATAGESHTLTVTASGGHVYLDGVIEYNGDENAGIQVYNCGSSGSTVPAWQATDLRSVAATYSTLYTVELGVNDANDSTAPATFLSDLNSLLADIRTACSDMGAPAPVFVLVVCYLQYGADTPPWQEYVSAIHAVAQANSDTTVVDLTELMPASTGSGAPYGLYYTDGAHPSQIGHSRIADLLCEFLSPEGPA